MIRMVFDLAELRIRGIAPSIIRQLMSPSFKLGTLQEKYRNAFMGYGPEDTNFCLELTENYDKDSYDLGTGFGHFALALPDVYKTCESIKEAGEPSHTQKIIAAHNGHEESISFTMRTWWHVLGVVLLPCAADATFDMCSNRLTL